MFPPDPVPPAGERKILKCKRGWLGTTPRPHSKGSLVFPLTMFAVAALSRAAEEKDRAFHLANVEGFPGDGYVLVERELAGWTKIATDQIKTPSGCDLRGAFGTRPDAHAMDTLLYAMPFRYYDRYTRRSDDTDLHWWEARRRAGGATWKSIRWEERPVRSCDIKVFARVGDSPRWTGLPATPMARAKTTPRRFFEFDDPRGGSLAGTRGDELDVRMMIEYLDGAYAQGEWKESPRFRALEVEYEEENVVHRHEEK